MQTQIDRQKQTHTDRERETHKQPQTIRHSQKQTNTHTVTHRVTCILASVANKFRRGSTTDIRLGLPNGLTTIRTKGVPDKHEERHNISNT